MDTRQLSLAPRLALAALSGALTFPAIRLDSALGAETYVLSLPWWIILHGLVFGLLVMAPFITSDRHRPLRVIVLAVASILIYDSAIKIPDLIELNLPGDLGDFLVAGISGALLVATAVRFVAPLPAGLAYWCLAFLAGAIGGFIFAMTFNACDWDRCDSTGWLAVYTSGWIAWQGLVCAALFIGSRQGSESLAAYGARTR